MATYFLAVSKNYWGRGTSLEEAHKQNRKAGGKGKTLYFQSSDPAMYVNDFGDVICTTPDLKQVTYTKVKKWVTIRYIQCKYPGGQWEDVAGYTFKEKLGPDLREYRFGTPGASFRVIHRKELTQEYLEAHPEEVK